jgi:hypothetical protein
MFKRLVHRITADPSWVDDVKGRGYFNRYRHSLGLLYYSHELQQVAVGLQKETAGIRFGHVVYVYSKEL